MREEQECFLYPEKNPTVSLMSGVYQRDSLSMKGAGEKRLDTIIFWVRWNQRVACKMKKSRVGGDYCCQLTKMSVGKLVQVVKEP